MMYNDFLHLSDEQERELLLKAYESIEDAATRFHVLNAVQEIAEEGIEDVDD